MLFGWLRYQLEEKLRKDVDVASYKNLTIELDQLLF
jgi:hypothetical protein